MTAEEAILIIDPKSSSEALEKIECYGGFSGKLAKVFAVREACAMAVAALREQEERDNRLESDAVKNEPLTLDELLKMDGEPVWVVCAIGEESMWFIVDLEECELKNPWDSIPLDYWNDGYPYSAYRSKPKEDA